MSLYEVLTLFPYWPLVFRSFLLARRSWCNNSHYSPYCWLFLARFLITIVLKPSYSLLTLRASCLVWCLYRIYQLNKSRCRCRCMRCHHWIFNSIFQKQLTALHWRRYAMYQQIVVKRGNLILLIVNPQDNTGLCHYVISVRKTSVIGSTKRELKVMKLFKYKFSSAWRDTNYYNFIFCANFGFP